MALDLTSFDFALKEYYTDDKIHEETYKDNVLFEMLPKDEKFYGDVLPVPLIYANPQGRSATFATAQTRAATSSTQGVKFNMTRVRDYGVVIIDNETMKASMNDKGAWLEARTVEVNGMLRQMGRSAATALYRGTSGTIARAASGFATATITLLNINDITNFEVGMQVGASATDGGGAVRVGTAIISAIDRDLGTLTTASGGGVWNVAIAAFVANDFIFVQGDYDAKPAGIAAWIPTTAPTATPFFGVNRSTDVLRLGGVRFVGTGLPYEEAVIEIISRIEREGGNPDYGFFNPFDWRQLEKSLGSKVQYVNPNAGGSANVGFKGITVSGNKGPVTLLADRNCPQGLAYFLQMDTWKCRSLGKMPTIFDTDGISMLRVSNADQVEVRGTAYYNLSCSAPGYNGVLTL